MVICFAQDVNLLAFPLVDIVPVMAMGTPIIFIFYAMFIYFCVPVIIHITYGSNNGTDVFRIKGVAWIALRADVVYLYLAMGIMLNLNTVLVS